MTFLPTEAALLTSQLREGLLWVNDGGRIEDANPAACALLGSQHEDLLGQTLLEATHLRSISEADDHACKTQTVCEILVRLVGPVERDLSVRALPRGAGKGTLVLLHDHTELLHLRTVRTEFVANVSHELRTPLASIRATAETLLDGAMQDAEMASFFLETIIREADRLVRLSEDLLELSRAESTEREWRFFDITNLLAEVAARLTSASEKRGVFVELLPAPPVWVRADRDEIAQVFFNLLDNAIKYTPGGGVVTASVETHDTHVFVTVADTGIGIQWKDLPRIFERFWRADRARKFQSGDGTHGTSGTGLGLSIVKHIIEAHGGTVRAESELNRGSRFLVSLPLPQETPDANEIPDHLPASASPQEPDADRN